MNVGYKCVQTTNLDTPQRGMHRITFSDIKSLALSGKMVKYQYKNCSVRTVRGDL